MPTHKLLLLPGDGIGPEVMAEVKRVIAWMNDHGMGTLRDRRGAGRRLLLRRTWGRGHRGYHGEGACGGCGDLRCGRRSQMGRRALRRAAGSRPAAAAQGPRAVRQSAPGGLLSGARRRLESQARRGGRARHRDRARAHRRGLFRRAEDHHRSRQRPEARASTPRSTTPTRSIASPASPSSWRASAATRSPRWRSAT